MMIRFLTAGILLLALSFALSGCGESEEAESTLAAPEPAVEKVIESTQAATGEEKDSAADVSEKAGKTEKQAGPVVQAVEETKAKAAAADKSESEATRTTEAAKEETAEAKREAAEAPEPVLQAVAPKTMVFEASTGKVTFPHAVHAGTYECAKCHGEGTPGLFDLDKTKAHALCRGCHREEGVGPTGCKGCHKK